MSRQTSRRDQFWSVGTFVAVAAALGGWVVVTRTPEPSPGGESGPGAVGVVRDGDPTAAVNPRNFEAPAGEAPGRPASGSIALAPPTPDQSGETEFVFTTPPDDGRNDVPKPTLAPEPGHDAPETGDEDVPQGPEPAPNGGAAATSYGAGDAEPLDSARVLDLMPDVELASLKTCTLNNVFSTCNHLYLVVGDEKYEVLLSGVESPSQRKGVNEARFFEQEAKAFLKNLLDSRPLSFHPVGRDADHPEVVAGHLFLVENPRVVDVGAELILAGFGFAVGGANPQVAELYETFEADARDARRGLWGEPDHEQIARQEAERQEGFRKLNGQHRERHANGMDRLHQGQSIVGDALSKVAEEAVAAERLRAQEQNKRLGSMYGPRVGPPSPSRRWCPGASISSGLGMAAITRARSAAQARCAYLDLEGSQCPQLATVGGFCGAHLAQMQSRQVGGTISPSLTPVPVGNVP